MFKFFHFQFSFRLLEKTSRNVKLFFILCFSLGILFLCWNGMAHGNVKAWDFFHRYDMGKLIRYGEDPVKFVNTIGGELPKSNVLPGFSPHHIDFPWTQSLFALFSIIHPVLALALYRILQLLCLLFCINISIYYLNNKFHIERLSAAMIVCFFYQTLYIRTDFNSCNTGILALAGMFLCYYGWDKKKNWLEAVGLAILCMKPQTGFLFVLLFFLEKHFWTLIWTGIYCLICSVPEMIYLHKIPWNFLGNMLSIKYLYTSEPQTCGLFGVFYHPSCQTVIMVFNAIASIAILTIYWYRYSSKDPMLRLLPAAIGTIFWSYSRIYHFLFLIVPMLCLTGLLKEWEDDDSNSSFFAFLCLFLLWIPIMHHFQAYIFFAKFLIVIFSTFYIGYHFNKLKK